MANDGQYTIKIGSVGDTTGADKVAAALNETGTAAARAAGMFQDAQGRWKTASGAFATDAQKAAAGVREIGNAAPSIDRATKALNAADRAADDFVASLKMGVGIDIGGRLVNAVAAIPQIMIDFNSRGVQFNATLENTQTAVAAVLEKFQGLGRDQALIEAGNAVEELKRKAVAAPGTIQQLAEAWIASAGAASAANIPVHQQIDLMVRLSQAVSRLALPQQQLVQETRALLTGNITLDAQLAKTLGVTNDSIKAAKEQGDLYGYLVQQIGALGEASDTMDVRWSNFQDQLDQIAGEATKPIFSVLRDAIAEVSEALSRGGSQSLKNFGYEIANLIRIGTQFTTWAAENSTVVLWVAKAVGALAAAWVAFGITAVVVGLNRKAIAILANKSAIEAETRALERQIAVQATASTKVGGAGLASKAMLGGGAVLTGIAGGYAIQDSLYNLDISAAFGGASTEVDLQKTKDLIEERSRLQKEYNAAAKDVSSEEQRAALIEKIKADLIAMGTAQAKLSWNETGQNNLLEAEIRHTQKLLDIVQKMSLEKFAQAAKEKEIAEAAKARAEEEARIREQNAEADKKAREDFDQSRAQSSRAQGAERSVERVKYFAERGQGDAATQSADNTLAYYQDILQKLEEAAKTATGDELKKNLALQQDIAGYIEALKAARAEIPDAVAKADKKAAEDTKNEQTKALQDQLALVDAEGQKRLADLERLGLAEEDMAKRRLEIENEIAARRLEIENQIGEAQGESALRRDARQIAAAAEKTQRENTARDAVDEALKPDKVADRKIDARRRRSSADVARGEDYMDLGRSRLRDYNSNFQDLAAATAPSRLPPPAALPQTPAAQPGQPGQPEGGGAPANTVADSMQAAAEAIKASQDALNASAKAVEAAAGDAKAAASAANAAADAIKTNLADLRAGMDNLRRSAS